MSQPTSAGWYPDPSDPSRNIYWDGTSWSWPPSSPTAQQPQQSQEGSGASKKTAVAVGVCILAAIGLFMTMQSVSLFSGTGSIWTGVAIVCAATATSFFLGATKWVRVVATICLVFALFNALYVEKQVSDKRNEISEIFNN